MKIYTSKKAEKQIKESYKNLLKLWNIPVKEIDVQGKYGSTHVIEFGQENLPPLVLFHGVGDDAALMWVYNASELGKHFKCYAVDTIGGPGLSVPGAGYDKTFEDSVWIEELLDSLGLTKVYLAGVSNGGYLTQSFMMDHPERVIKGISMAGGIPMAGKKAAMGAMLKIFLPEALFPTDKNVVKLVKKMCGSNYPAFTENPVVFEHFKQLMLGFNRKAMLYHKVRKYPLEKIETLRDRCLYIFGEKDPFIKGLGLDYVKNTMEQLKMNTLWFEDSGHGINHESAKEVNSAIIEYLI